MKTFPPQGSERQHTYPFDAESVVEMARLINQAELITKHLGSFPEEINMSRVRDVLDLASGPGSWVLDIAYMYPKINVVGVDLSELVVEYAQATAWARRLENASFRVMDVMKPLAFADSSFDMVNARFLAAFMLPEAWPRLMQECWRITRPGGTTILTDCEAAITTSPALERLQSLGTQAMKKVGQSFSPDGRNFGITPMLSSFLRDAGFRDVQLKAYVIDFSAGTEAHYGFYQDFMIMLNQGQPFLIKTGMATAEEVEYLQQLALAEMMMEDFRGIWYYLRAWGRKPK